MQAYAMKPTYSLPTSTAYSSLNFVKQWPVLYVVWLYVESLTFLSFLKMHYVIVLRITVLFFLSASNCQLIVNVKNNGGDVYRENINANTTQDTVSLEFRQADGTVVTQFIDGRNVR